MANTQKEIPTSKELSTLDEYGRAEFQEKASRQNVDIALRTIRDLMNTITKHFDEGQTVFQVDLNAIGPEFLKQVGEVRD